MGRLWRARVFVVVIGAAIAVPLRAGQSPADKTASAQMQSSVTSILVRAQMAANAKKPLALQKTTFTDSQLNAWLKMDGKANVPVGLVSPQISFDALGKLTARGLVDLDGVRKSKERGVLDPMNYLSGSLPIVLVGKLSGVSGAGTFDVESATLNGVTVPRLLIQELIAYYSKSPDFPDGITLGKPFPLPAGVKTLLISKGSATVVQ